MKAHRWSKFAVLTSVMAVMMGSFIAGPALSASGASSAPGVTASTITVGFVTDITGIASSTFSDSAAGAKAAIDAQNAAGGVDGRKLKLVVKDTTSTPAGALTAAQVLVGDNVFGVDEESALFFGASSYLHQKGIPVTGSDLDGPEWLTQPNTNMFNIEGTASPLYPSYTNFGLFWKSVGAKKISITDSTTPSSTRAAKQEETSITTEGLANCSDATVPLGSVDFTGIALAIKQAGCDGAECSCVLSSSLALSAALQNLGLHIPVVFDAGPSQGVLQSATTEKEATGAYFPSQAYYSGPAYDKFIAALKKYDPSYTGGLPDLGLIGGWEGMGLFIEGLQKAGKNLTRTSFIAKLRTVSSWNDNGLKPTAASFVHFGEAPETFCEAYQLFNGKKYSIYPASGKPICGKLIPNSNSA